MTHRLLFGSLLALTLACPSAAYAQAPSRAVAPPAGKPKEVGPFNFTPSVVEMDFDGFLAKVIVFKDGQLRRHVNLPNGWVAAGSPNELYLTNPKYPDARITLRVSTLEAPMKFDGPWIEATSPLILGGLPKDSQLQKIANVSPNVWARQGAQSIEFKTTFDRIGRRFATAWLFIRLADGRFLEVVYSSPDDKFVDVRAAAIDMMNGWELHLDQTQTAGR